MTSPTSRPVAAPSRRAGVRTSGSYRAFMGWAQRNGLFFALIALIALFSVIGKNFLTVNNFIVILQNVSVVGLIAIGGITYGLTKLKPALATLERSTAVIETVKRGEMVRDVRGNGTLVPDVTRMVPAPADGRVERILLKAGIEVDSSTVIVELSNPNSNSQRLMLLFR